VYLSSQSRTLLIAAVISFINIGFMTNVLIPPHRGQNPNNDQRGHNFDEGKSFFVGKIDLRVHGKRSILLVFTLN
jgi:hypothetical protein